MILPFAIESRKSLGLPAALIGLITVNVWFHVFFTAVDTFDLMGYRTYVEWFAFDPAHPAVAGLVFSMFTHAGWLHLCGNMFFLWVFGWVLEDKIGWKKFLLLYLGCGLMGSLIEWAMYLAAKGLGGPTDDFPGIGASGCVMGITGVTLSRYYNSKIRILNPFIAPLILWFLLIIFLPEWRSDIAGYLLFYLPFCYILPLTARKMVYRAPLWVMAVYYFVGDYAMVLKGIDDGVNHLIHAFCFLAGLGAGWLLYLPQENLDEALLDRAREDARNGFYLAAVSQYIEWLGRHPGDAEARCELADFYLHKSEKERFFKRGDREKALAMYQWAMELWLAQGREMDAVRVFRSLKSAFRDEEYRPRLLEAIQNLGEKDKKLSLKAADRREGLEEEVRRLYAEANFWTANAALLEWWKLGDLSQSDPAFLILAGEIFGRIGERAKSERIYEFLAEHGDEIQAARALHFLFKGWMGTPRQIHLKVVFRHALERLPGLGLNHEITELSGRIQ